MHIPTHPLPLLPLLLLFTTPLLAISPICIPSTNGYDISLATTRANDFCTRLAQRNFSSSDWRTYGLPFLSFGFVMEQQGGGRNGTMGRCDLVGCRAALGGLLDGCEFCLLYPLPGWCRFLNE
jgi:hypothetical protein